MRVVGLVVEYNPFHNGHAYHLNQAKTLTNADYVIAIMSGNFLQRGMPSLLDKWTRTQMALNNGIDLVIQLPVYYSSSSAEYFASSSIQLLNELGVVNSICFGSECGNIELLKDIATVLVEEPNIYRSFLQDYLRKGLSFPLARSNALIDYFNKTNASNLYNLQEIKVVLESPNNILGIEYMKALIKSHSTLTPITIKRKTSGYHDISMKDSITSASAIRHSLEKNNLIDELEGHVPTESYGIMKKNHKIIFPIFTDDFSSILYFALLNKKPNELLDYVDVSEGLEDRILHYCKEFKSISDLIDKVKTKRFTYTRIQRTLFHILLEIKKTDFQVFNNNNYSQYIKILGFNKNSQPLLKYLKRNANLPIISNVNKSFNYLTTPAIKMLEKDIYATNVYNLIVYQKYGNQIPNDLNKKFIIK